MDYTLNIENIEFLKKEIGKSGLTFSHLRDDLIDHVCCDVEYEMRNGLPFAKAYDLVKEKIGIGGLERIQLETLYLIDKKYRTMKKTMKISGLVAPIILSFGALFKIQHWHGASILMLIGFFFLSFVFLPSAIYVSYKEVSNLTKKSTHIVGFLGTFFVSLSFLFKLMHWPGANIILVLGIVLICLVFLPMVMINRLRDKEASLPKYVFVLALLGIIFYLAAMLFKTMHWPGASTMMIAGSVLLIFVAVPIYVFKIYKEQSNIANSFIFITVALIWFVVPTTMMSLRVSPDILKPAYEISDYMTSDYKIIKDKNDMIFSGMKGDPSAVEVQKSANELLFFIQDIKVKMVKISGGNPVISSDNVINMSGVNGGAIGMYHEVLFNKEKEALKLKEMLRKFEDALLAVSSDAEYATIIRKTIAYPINPEDNPAESLLMSLNKLSFLQINICLAEKTALREINRNKMIAEKK
jgi:hypothetical protein